MSACVVCQAVLDDGARFCAKCGAEQPKTELEGDDPFIGRAIAGNFKIEKLLGVGGMGKVYRARQLSLDKTVVIKVLHDHFRDDPQLVQRFQREAKAASRLNHPNSIQVIDFGQDESGVLFMAIEFLKGTDLFTVLTKEGPFAAERVARIMIQVCSALAEAHEMNVIHRDLEPENIMVEDRRGRTDVVKVLDFGIAKIQDPETEGQALTQAGMVCGTPEYMSPEQARGQQLDHRADLYSLGVLVYQLVTGELPFWADSPIGIVTKHILEQPIPPRERAPQRGIPPALEAIILKAMAKEADARYQSAGELQDAFESLLRELGGGYPAQRPATPRSGTLIAAGSHLSTAVGSPVESLAPGAPTGVNQPPPATVQDAGPASQQPTAAGYAQPASPTANSALVEDTRPDIDRSTTAMNPPVAPAGTAPAGAAVSASVVDLDYGLEETTNAGKSKTAAIAAAATVVVFAVAGGIFAMSSGDDSAERAPVVVANGQGNPAAEPAKTPQPPATPPVAANAGGSEEKKAAAATSSTARKKKKKKKASSPTLATRTSKKAAPKLTAKSDGPTTPAKTIAPANSGGSRLRAERLVRKAQKKWEAGDHDGAYALWKKAASADRSFAKPRQLISQYWRLKGDKIKACAAMKDFVKLKGSDLSRARASRFLSTVCE